MGPLGGSWGGGWDLGSTFVGGGRGGSGTSGQHLGVWVNTLLTCLSSHTCHFSTKFQSKFVYVLIQIKIRTFGDIMSGETTSVLLQSQLVFCCYVQKISFFKSRKKCSLQKITRPKLLLFQPGGSGRIERGGQCGLWSVSASHHKAFYPPVTLHSCNHQLPSTKHRGSSSQGQ